jgi:KaiC/GvpD/RAD55 family RecA-like ATPase
MSSEIEFVPTGIKGVDELLEGKGVPKGTISFVLGGPGSGKTTFGLQFLYQGIKQWNENALYISLDEEIRRLKYNAKKIDLDFEPLEKEKKIAFVDAAPLRSIPGEVKLGPITIGKRDFTLISLIDLIKRNVNEVNAKRLVIDPIVSLTLQYPNEIERRTAVLDLMQGILETGVTSLIVTELTQSSIERTYQFEEYLAQGVIIMRKIASSGGNVRVFTVEKMRGVDLDPQPHPYRIGKGGIEVFPSEIAF